MDEQEQTVAMDRDLRDRWCAALRGEGERVYEQGKRSLRNKDDTWCCIGVLCDVAGVEWRFDKIADAYACDALEPATALPTNGQMDEWGLDVSTAWRLVYRNDGVAHETNPTGRVHTFAEQADWIEDNVPVKEAAQ